MKVHWNVKSFRTKRAAVTFKNYICRTRSASGVNYRARVRRLATKLYAVVYRGPGVRKR